MVDEQTKYVIISWCTCVGAQVIFALFAVIVYYQWLKKQRAAQRADVEATDFFITARGSAGLLCCAVRQWCPRTLRRVCVRLPMHPPPLASPYRQVAHRMVLLRNSRYARKLLVLQDSNSPFLDASSFSHCLPACLLFTVGAWVITAPGSFAVGTGIVGLAAYAGLSACSASATWLPG